MKPVAMHPALYEFLNEWRKESCYNKDGDWVFVSSREKEEFRELRLLVESTTFDLPR